MSCTQYLKQYKNLKSLTQEFEDKFNQLKETGQGTAELDKLNDKISSEQEKLIELLEKYFLSFEFGEKIEGFEYSINILQPLGNNKFLVAGSNGKTRILDLSDSNNPKFGEEIEGFNNWIYTLQPLGNNKFLAAGGNGETRILEKKLDLNQVEENG